MQVKNQSLVDTRGDTAKGLAMAFVVYGIILATWAAIIIAIINLVPLIVNWFTALFN